ncbi:MAG: 3'-5' exonuclease, partial [Nanoarchaeota archaeon]
NLTTNYRSENCIIELMNNVISNMALPNLEASIRENGEIRLFEFEDDDEEMQFIIKTIKEKRMEIGSVFVLGRTNRTILELSDRLKLLGVKHSVKTDDIKRYIESDTAEITLATIHSIKGMEADTVFVVGCTNNNFPCRASEHPVIEMIKIDEYDKEEEERRLLYVAISRAKKRLYISYTKSLTKFIDEKMKSNIPIIKSNRQLSDYNSETTSLISELKKWRTMLSSELGIPAYMVMHDRTIIDISVSKPLCSEDLENIYGMGYTKIKKYGEDILRIVSGIGSKSIQRTS